MPEIPDLIPEAGCGQRPQPAVMLHPYAAFGNELETAEQLPNRIRYAGQQFDDATGQYYLRARYYNSVLGRFMQEDTYQDDGLNLYTYCRNNSVVYYDPSGYCGENSGIFAGDGGEGNTYVGPYAYLEDGPTVGPGKNFTGAQRLKIIEENMKRNDNIVKSDDPNDYKDVLTKPKKSMKGVTPDPYEWQIDHIKPKSKGTNSYANARVITRKLNREKWNKEE